MIIWFLFFLEIFAHATTTSIKDPNANYQMKVNADGSINVDGGGGGTFPVTQGTIPWIVNGSSYPQPVSQSGTWNLNNISGTISLPTGASTSSNQSTQIGYENTIASNTTTLVNNQTNASQKTQIVDGTGNVVGPLLPINSINRLPVVTSGRGVLSTFTQSYSSNNLSTSVFSTIISSTSATINEEDIFDNSGGIYYLAYASTCVGLSSATNAIIVGAGGGIKDFQIPASQCVGFQAIGTNITIGNVYMTFYK
jgi:hypothetical protein